MNMHRLIWVSFLALTGMVGCVVDNASETDNTPDTVEAQSNIVRVSAEEISALKTGEVLRLDLTNRDAVYDVEFFDVADLDQVVVVSASGEYKLSEKAPKAKQGERGRLVLAADSSLARDYASSLPVTPAKGTADGDLGEAAQALRAICIDIYDFGDVVIVVVYNC